MWLGFESIFDRNRPQTETPVNHGNPLPQGTPVGHPLRYTPGSTLGWGRGFAWLLLAQNRQRYPTTIPPHPYQTPTRIHTEARAGAAPTRPTTRPPQIGKCAPVRPPPAPRGAFVDLGRPGGGYGGDRWGRPRGAPEMQQGWGGTPPPRNETGWGGDPTQA